MESRDVQTDDSRGENTSSILVGVTGRTMASEKWKRTPTHSYRRRNALSGISKGSSGALAIKESFEACYNDKRASAGPGHGP